MTALCTLLLCLTAVQLNAQVIPFSMTDEAANQNTPDGWTAVSLPTGLPEFTAANTFYINAAPYNASTESADNTTAIQAALDAAAAAGGGMVVVPAGTYLTSYLQMGSKTVLHLCAGATLKMLACSTYPTDDNGYHKMENPLITGKSGASDIVIEGESQETSIIDGQGAPWWDEVEAAKAESKSTTRQALIRFWQGSRYLFRNFRIQNAPNTNICIGRSGNGSHATAHDITIKNPASTAADPSHNTDGFPIWTKYVNIYDCEIDTGDDNVVTDSGAQFVHVWNCDLKAGHGASLGSYTVDMHDILYEGLTFTGTDCGFRLKSNRDRSGDVYNITFRNCTMTGVASPFVITSWYDTLPDAATVAASPDDLIDTTPRFHDILIQNVTVSGHTTYQSSGKNYYGIFIYGRPESLVKDVTFDNVNITHSKGIKMNFCEGIKFKDCSITVNNTNNTSKNGASTDENLPDKLFEEKYQGSYMWNSDTSEAILSWQLGTNGADATAANSITGATGSAAEGFTIAITGNAGKNWTQGNGTITYNGTSYKTLKNSNGAQNTITLPTGMYAHKVEFYAVTNDGETKGKLSEFNGSSCSDDVNSLKDYSNPTYIAKEFDTGVNSFTFTFSTKQVCFIAVVSYNDTESSEPDPYVDPAAYTNTWQFGKVNDAPEFALQKSAEYVYTVNEHSLTINTDAGKLNNASRTDQWAQCNNGTLFKVPTFEGAKLTWGRYNGGSETGFTIGGQLYNEYYIATEDGTTNMTATGISYLSHITVQPVTMYEITGTITGGDVNSKDIIFTAAGNGQKYTATIAENAFTLKVPADTYTPELGGDVAYVISSPASVTVSEAGSIGAVTIVAATPQTVTGAITNAPAEAFTLTFTATNNAEHNATVNCAANATSFSTALDPDTYTISTSVGTLSPLSVESFQVVKEAISHNIYFPETIPAATQQNITVDNTLPAATANNYKTISDALAAAKAGSISNPVITLTSGQTYKEQVIVDQANVTLKTSGAGKATITWYYGIGYCYYSLAANGYYDKDRAMTRNSLLHVHPARWGATVLVKSTGNGFKAENIIFENSFNQRYTDEEIADGVLAYPMGDTQITYNRTLTSGQSGYKAADARDVTERAAAIGFENDPTGCELYDCVFIGSQDTFYSSGSIYVKNCDIQGNTDYIFGGGQVVFDDCDLTIGGYSDKLNTAYITAQKGNTGSAYIFRDCTVKSAGRTYTAANLGRDWGGASATVYFFNLKNEIDSKMSYTWSNMGGAVTAGTANLHIYDFDPAVNANYATTGASGANINGLVSDADALNLYAGVVTRLAFTPEHIYDGNLELGESSAYNVCRIAANDNVARTVALTRSITANKWSSICLPFALTEGQITAAFGSGAKVAELQSSTANELTFSTVTAMEANKPYAIKVAADVTDATISGVTVKQADPAQVVGDWTFNGTYTATTAPVGSYVFNGNQLRRVTEAGVNVKAFRGYFTSNDATANELTIVIDGETTGLSEIERMRNGENETFYDLQGRRVAQPNSQFSILNSQLNKGLYIVNGKKVVIK